MRTLLSSTAVFCELILLNFKVQSFVLSNWNIVGISFVFFVNSNTFEL